jgi:signal peptidase
MEPTIGTDDGFLIVPADGIESGDVVTFRSAERDDYVTHRIVGETERGYITKGDNNPTTDQAAGYAYVDREAITGEVATFQGRPVVVPDYGVAVRTVRQHRIPILGGLGVLFVVLLASGGGSAGRRDRNLERVGGVVLPLFLVAIVCAAGLILGGAYTEEVQFVAVQGGSSAPQTVPVGEPAATTIEINGSGSPLTRRVIGTSGATLTDRNTTGTTTTGQLRIPPQPAPGAHTARVTVVQYPAILPVELLRWLHGIHPAVAALVSTTGVLTPVYVLYLLTVDGRTPVRPTRSRWLRRLLEES